MPTTCGLGSWPGAVKQKTAAFSLAECCHDKTGPVPRTTDTLRLIEAQQTEH
jgi:hypothetical protein